ncbi:hypothetical protein MYCTH_2306433 [Thermothelomyces thermophilus ATCC 42464]|uniref:Uncharacterized protein n=1 Tax=Thermothelomyces thermophilus (strain ATCC 42464 / BCRC 31852 / DSM 1799) TaxID=573729 RepID=G2QHF2_THET4|nr:uncharacterized protein MYCTH_2306433 [Thermothelomyces thermophilus ATCC 42464]AEO58812.1 hypothetical protein MYCTH_2306433 [Thermothelomyces thermophilus ATCC 42464]
MVWQRRAKISHEFTTEIAGVINQFTQQQSAAIEEQKAKYHKYIKRLKRELVEESGVITQQMSQIDAQANRIEDLQNSKEHVESQMKEIKAKLEASESRIRRLEEKYRACKTHLNSAIQEQQDLYTRSKKQWEDTIEEVRRIEKSRNLETEMTVRKAEAVREQMMEKVRQTIAQSKSEAVELYGKINTLTQQVEEKDAELSRERESVRFLTEKLQNIESVSSSFEALSSQGRDILQRIEEEQMRAEERQQQSMKGIRDRIDVVSARLETLSNIMSEQPDILSSLREVQKDSWDNITGKLDSILELRSAATEATSQLSADLEHQLGKVWQRLDSQIETLTRQLAEKAEENGMVSTLYKRNDAECEEHLNELAILRATTEKQANQIHELEASLIASDTVHDENEKTIRLLEARGAEAEKLKRELESKAAAVVELQSKLDAKEGAYVSELQNYSSNIHELAKAFQEKDRSLATVAHQAAETARYETQLKTERIQTKLEQSLQETTLHRDSLIDQLRKLETTIQEKEQNEMRQAETICSLRQRVAVEEAKTQAAAQQLSQQSANLEQVEHRLGSQIKDLETKLRAASDLISGLENENQRQHARSETIAAGLKNWAHKEGVLIDEFDNLGTSDRSEKEISDFLTHTLELVLSARRSQTTSLETNPTGSVLGMENSSFLAGQTAEAPQAALQDHCQNDRVESDNPSGAMAYQTKREGDAVGRRHVKEPLSHAPTLHNLRRVVVRSPANVPSEPAAPSIDQEKMRRREAMQPKSIMKRVTRSATSKLRLEDSSFAAEDGTFNINEQDATQSAVPQKQEDSASYAESMALNTDTPENKEALSRHPKKRRRSRTAGSEDWAGSSTNLGHGGKGESSKHSTELKTERMDSRVYISVATGHEEKGARPRTNKYDSYGEKPVARHPRRHSDSGPQDLPRTLSATNPKRLSQRQTNVRTYGSQRATGDPLELQPLLQSQSESRYWRLRSKAESQEPVTS